MTHDINQTNTSTNAASQLQKPPQYNVVLLNDDFTPMDFVVSILQNFFAMDEATAVQVMLQVHQQGKAVCGCYTRDIAETKVAQVEEYAASNEHPLRCEMEVA